MTNLIDVLGGGPLGGAGLGLMNATPSQIDAYHQQLAAMHHHHVAILALSLRRQSVTRHWLDVMLDIEIGVWRP